MNQPRTAGLNMSLRNFFLATAIGLVIWASGAAAQESLGEFVKEYGVDWMIGRWVATTSEGDKIETLYQWQLDKHLVTMSFKGGGLEARGMIFYSPSADEVVQVGVDNKGGSNSGVWEVEADKAVAKIVHTEADGQTHRIAIVHSKLDAQTMKVEFYSVDSAGERAEEPLAALEYKRQKRTRRQTSDKTRDISKGRRKRSTDSNP